MSKHIRPFKFKQFEVSHHRSSMKVGIDAVILGAWADVCSAGEILDVGCGCGVISLMVAQRNQYASITGIDIDSESVNEAEENFQNSPWGERLSVLEKSFSEYAQQNENHSIDYIISNPPYFDSGIMTPETTREKARHQGNLSPEIILDEGRKLLKHSGKIGLVVPADQAQDLSDFAVSIGMKATRLLIMNGRAGREPKRVFIEFSFSCEEKMKIQYLTIEDTNGDYTPEYRNLCKDFYLKF